MPRPPLKILKSIVHDGVVAAWNTRWKADPSCRQTRMWFPEVRPRMSAALMCDNREVLSMHILVISGHNFWRRQNFLVDSERVRRGKLKEDQLVPPFCDLCLHTMPQVGDASYDDFLQTTHHLFSECEALVTQRREVLGDAFNVDLSKVKKQNILKFVRAANLSIFPEKHEELAASDNSEVLNEEDD